VLRPAELIPEGVATYVSSINLKPASWTPGGPNEGFGHLGCAPGLDVVSGLNPGHLHQKFTARDPGRTLPRCGRVDELHPDRHRHEGGYGATSEHSLVDG
jgi:hypothetical protein